MNRNRIKIFSAPSIASLELDINNWLSKLEVTVVVVSITVQTVEHGGLFALASVHYRIDP